MLLKVYHIICNSIAPTAESVALCKASVVSRGDSSEFSALSAADDPSEDGSLQGQRCPRGSCAAFDSVSRVRSQPPGQSLSQRATAGDQLIHCNSLRTFF